MEPPRPRGVPWGPQLVSELQGQRNGGPRYRRPLPSQTVVIRPPPILRLLCQSLARGIPLFQFVIEGKAHGHECSARGYPLTK
jgi:hypothetical protein